MDTLQTESLQKYGQRRNNKHYFKRTEVGKFVKVQDEKTTTYLLGDSIIYMCENKAVEEQTAAEEILKSEIWNIYIPIMVHVTTKLIQKDKEDTQIALNNK